MIARQAEEAEPDPDALPQIGPAEAATRGPVLIDTTTGAVRDAETGVMLVAPPERAEGRESEVDLTYIAFGLTVAATIVAILAAALAPWSPSQRLGVCAVILFVAGERVWLELRRFASRPAPTAPEGVMYVAQQQPDQIQ